jgi:hypothetical protein
MYFTTLSLAAPNNRYFRRLLGDWFPSNGYFFLL